MSEARHGISEKRFESVMGMMLRAGVSLAAAVVLAGGVLYLVRHGAAKPDYTSFHGEADGLRSLRAILGAAAAGRAPGLIQLGLLILVATPVARVAFSVIAYVSERVWLYTAVTLVVLGILVYSLTSA